MTVNSTLTFLSTKIYIWLVFKSTPNKCYVIFLAFDVMNGCRYYTLLFSCASRVASETFFWHRTRERHLMRNKWQATYFLFCCCVKPWFWRQWGSLIVEGARCSKLLSRAFRKCYMQGHPPFRDTKGKAFLLIIWIAMASQEICSGGKSPRLRQSLCSPISHAIIRYTRYSDVRNTTA